MMKQTNNELRHYTLERPAATTVPKTKKVFKSTELVALDSSDDEDTPESSPEREPTPEKKVRITDMDEERPAPTTSVPKTKKVFKSPELVESDSSDDEDTPESSPEREPTPEKKVRITDVDEERPASTTSVPKTKKVFKSTELVEYTATDVMRAMFALHGKAVFSEKWINERAPKGTFARLCKEADSADPSTLFNEIRETTAALSSSKRICWTAAKILVGIKQVFHEFHKSPGAISSSKASELLPREAEKKTCALGFTMRQSATFQGATVRRAKLLATRSSLEKGRPPRLQKLTRTPLKLQNHLQRVQCAPERCSSLQSLSLSTVPTTKTRPQMWNFCVTTRSSALATTTCVKSAPT